MAIGEIIKDCRLKKELTQEELGNIFFVSRQLISKWENGKSYPDLNQLIQLSDYFDLSLDELMRGDKKMIKKKDLQANIGRKGKWVIVVIAVILISAALYFSIWSIKVHTLYKHLRDDNWSDKGFYYTKTEDSVQYVVFKNQTHILWYLPEKLPLQAQANYTNGERAMIGGVMIHFEGDTNDFTVTWSNNALRGQSLQMDSSFEYKNDLQPLEKQSIPYEFEKVFNKELDIERPYLKSFLNEVEKKWKEINE